MARRVPAAKMSHLLLVAKWTKNSSTEERKFGWRKWSVVATGALLVLVGACGKHYC